MHHNFSISPDLSTANIIAEQMNDPDLKPIIQQLTSQPNNLLDNGKTFREFTMKSGVLLKILDQDKPINSSNTRIAIPESLQLVLTATYHVAMGHMHARNLYKILSAYYYRKSLRKTVDKLTTSCAFCSMYKISQLRKCPLSNFQLATFPTEIFGMDHFFLPKRLGFTCVLLIMDLFSQFTFAFACRDESAKSVCAHLKVSLSLLRSQAVSKLLPGGNFASSYELFFNRKPLTPLITPDHLLDNFAFLNKSPADVDNLRKMILQDLTKLKKNYRNNCRIMGSDSLLKSYKAMKKRNKRL